MSNTKKPYRINNKDVVVKAENVLYNGSGVENVENVEQAIDSIKGEIDPQPAEYLYTEEDCTIENTGIYRNGGVGSNSGYNCSDYIPIPSDKKLKMYVKSDGMMYDYGIYFYSKRTGTYQFMNGTAVLDAFSYPSWTEITLPDTADAFRFNFNKSGTYVSIKLVEQPVASTPAVKLKVAAWNIGGLSGGSSSSSITNANADAKRAAYRKQIDECDADIICISEYSTVFNTSTSSQTRSDIFANYPYCKLGKEETYNYNCVFSKFPILATREIDYTVRDMNRYIKEVTLKLNGKIVKVVATHLSEENDAHTTNLGITQIAQLIDLYADDPYVIIGADFNIHVTDTMGDYASNSGTDGYLNYKYFTEEGYTLMNYDYLNIANPYTYPAGHAKAGQLSNSTADNIAVKGFAMGKREYVYEANVSNELSDHAMVACELVMLL